MASIEWQEHSAEAFNDHHSPSIGSQTSTSPDQAGNSPLLAGIKRWQEVEPVVKDD
jgi:hypothetical protein